MAFGENRENRYIACGNRRKNAYFYFGLFECPSLTVYVAFLAMSKAFVTIAALSELFIACCAGQTGRLTQCGQSTFA